MNTTVDACREKERGISRSLVKVVYPSRDMAHVHFREMKSGLPGSPETLSIIPHLPQFHAANPKGTIDVRVCFTLEPAHPLLTISPLGTQLCKRIKSKEMCVPTLREFPQSPRGAGDCFRGGLNRKQVECSG